MTLMDGLWRRQAAGAAFGFAVILSQSPAQAQFYGGWGPYPFPMPPPVIYPRAAQPGYQPIPPGTIRRMVANMGLRLMAAPRQNGRIYLAETEDPHGQRRRLVFDAYDGTVVQNVPLGAALDVDVAHVATQGPLDPGEAPRKFDTGEAFPSPTIGQPCTSSNLPVDQGLRIIVGDLS
jgi:hypothetical protein